jgi:hypothetical protein
MNNHNYALFCDDSTSSKIGWETFIGFFEKIEEAKKLFDLLFEEKFENRPCRWAQIVCLKTSKIIEFKKEHDINEPFNYNYNENEFN